MRKAKLFCKTKVKVMGPVGERKYPKELRATNNIVKEFVVFFSRRASIRIKFRAKSDKAMSKQFR